MLRVCRLSAEKLLPRVSSRASSCRVTPNLGQSVNSAQSQDRLLLHHLLPVPCLQCSGTSGQKGRLTFFRKDGQTATFCLKPSTPKLIRYVFDCRLNVWRARDKQLKLQSIVTMDFPNALNTLNDNTKRRRQSYYVYKMVQHK